MNIPACIELAVCNHAVPIIAIHRSALESTLAALDPGARAWAVANGFSARPDSWLAVPDASGAIALVLAGIEDAADPRALSALPMGLPEGRYGLHPALGERIAPGDALLGWGLGAYRFSRYLAPPRAPAVLVLDPASDLGEAAALLEASLRVRDLVNTPTQDLGPDELEAEAAALAQRHSASIRVVKGDALLRENFPAIHAVGRASHRAPRLIELRWGDPSHPRLAIVGKGVCFDTGGLDIKPSSAMGLMKKDMGGAAHVLGLAHMIMSENLPVRLRVLIPAVENAVDGNSFRPGDIIKTRKGLSVEIGNTDAEGRLVLCDAIAEACSEKPDLIIDFATLTGAARVALGPDLPAMFSNNDAVANDLLKSAEKVQDPLWRLPLWQPYNKMIDTPNADVNNSGAGGHAGAITAALFLERFVDKDVPWVHIDTFAWNPGNKPGRPEGGEALGMRASYEMLREKYGKQKQPAAKKAKGPKK